MTPSIHKVMFNVSRLIISNEQENAWEEGLYILFGYIYLFSTHQFSQRTHFLLALTFTLAFALTFALAFFFSLLALFVVSNHAFFTGSLVERWWHYIIITTSTSYVLQMPTVLYWYTFSKSVQPGGTALHQGGFASILFCFQNLSLAFFCFLKDGCEDHAKLIKCVTMSQSYHIQSQNNNSDRSPQSLPS